MAVKVLNKDNWIQWQGEFAQTASVAIANGDTAQMKITDASVVLYPLENDQAAFGINYNSFEFTQQDNPAMPAVWDAVARRITYYLPGDALPNTVRLIKYRWRDINGTLSNEATVSIAVNAAATYWRGLESSRYCVQVSGDNTGMVAYSLLERVYTATNTPYVPAETKANTEGQPDYIAPTENTTLCPLPITGMPHVADTITLHMDETDPDGPRIQATIQSGNPVEEDIHITGGIVAYIPTYQVETFNVMISAGETESFSTPAFFGQGTEDHVIRDEEFTPPSVKRAGADIIADFIITIV